ncbi:LacI family DNA-binding transcriptional regulator [Schaalia vaccimaxillae]|uniref:LacI family DNA-binding transcriptional regulator n=1 Tax=Schaalia vaccimaxillae TaxID=183916 RepID=UPI0003B5214A|nr:LacI family DNA-binding transcriptional regulator [Schaalia vaccimaxillae]
MPAAVGGAPKLHDVAERAGVSLGTASNVLNHPERVSPSTIDRVRRAIDELGFVRNANASSLAAGGSGSIGLVVISLANSMFVEAARGAQAAARKAGHNLLLADSVDDFQAQGDNVDSFNEARVAGLLLAPMQDSAHHIAKLKARGVPVVLINYDQGDGGQCTVVVDNEHVGYMAVRHMIDIGCHHIAFVAGQDEEYQPVRMRRSGIHRAFAECGPEVVFEEINVDNIKESNAVEVALEILDRPSQDRPDGIIAVTDGLAASIVNTLCSRGVSIPHEIAVMGCDNNLFASDCVVPLTSIAMQGYAMGEAAINLLLAEMVSVDTHVHQRTVLTPELIVRNSTMRRETTSR